MNNPPPSFWLEEKGAKVQRLIYMWIYMQKTFWQTNWVGEWEGGRMLNNQTTTTLRREFKLGKNQSINHKAKWEREREREREYMA